VSLLQAKLLTATEHPISSTSQSLPRPRSRVSSRLPLQWTDRHSGRRRCAPFCASPPPEPTSSSSLFAPVVFVHVAPPHETKHISSACLAERGALHLASSRTWVALSCIHSTKPTTQPQHHVLGFSALPAPPPARPNTRTHPPRGMGYRRHAALFHCLVSHVAQRPRTAAD
jgi:hypothetical protein